MEKDELQRIEDEELSRLRARKKFESERTFLEKAWAVANSAVVLALVSTAGATFVGYWYANYKEATKLQYEIENRRDVTLKALSHIKKEADSDDYYGPQWASQKALNLLNGGDPDPNFASFQPTRYPEYKSKEFKYLLNDLKETSWWDSPIEEKQTKYNELEKLRLEHPSERREECKTLPEPEKIKCEKPTDEDKRIVKAVVDRAIQIISSM
jgi:hypothetical protein